MVREPFPAIRVLLIIAGAFAVMFVLAYLASPPIAREELIAEAGKAAFQAGIVGVLVAGGKFALDEYARDRQARADEAIAKRASREASHQRLLDGLNDLTDSHWAIKKALLIVDAQGSAMSYGNQMRVVVDHRLLLRRLRDGVRAGLYDLGSDADADCVSKSLDDLDQPLQELTLEWRAEYVRLSGLQKEDTEIKDPKKKKVPPAIAALPMLAKARANDFAAIHAPFERAAQPFRRQLASDRIEQRDPQPSG